LQKPGELDVPKYFFNIRKGDVLEEAADPIEIDALGEINEEAIEAARDLLAEGDLVGLDRRDWAFEVLDEGGEVVLEFAFKDAVEPDLPDSSQDAE
jgi:hypothetical protein